MRRIIWWGACLILFTSTELAVSRIAHAEDFSSGNYQVLAPVITSGGIYATSSSFSLLGVISEFAHDIGSSLTFGSNPGFAAYPFVSTPIISATAGNALVNLSWTAAVGFVGYSVSGYSVGRSTVSGGPYTFTSVGAVLSNSVTGLTNGTPYYFIVRAFDPNSLVIATSTQVSATPTAPASPPPSDGGGGGGGGGGSVTPPELTATVILSGRAYPGSTVAILKDSVLQSRVPVQESAAFTSTISNLQSGTYLFSVYAQDTNGNQSATITIPVTVVAGVTTTVNGIFLAPTIDVDKAQVKRGNPLRVFGQSSPESTITIAVNSETELFFQTSSDKYGVYSYSFLTSPLELGSHSTHSKSSKSGQVSGASRSVSFTVGLQDVLKDKIVERACGSRGDLNCDSKVNLVDFSIGAFWYKKKGFPVAYDLNGDKAISLVDFSIMASNWTG